MKINRDFFYNENGEVLSFPSINAARQHFKVRWSMIKKKKIFGD
jgi:hypothetical protein